MRKIIVVGGGAAGLLAAYSAVKNNNQVILLEKNEKLGKKIYITGKGRCNVTTSVPKNEFFNGVISNPKFLYSALNCFDANDLVSLLNKNGLKTKEERGNRVFPESDKASDVTKTLEKLLVKNGVDIRLNTTVLGLIAKGGIIKGVKTDTGEISADSVIVCTGGISYPLTGSTGDGYTFAKDVGHNVIDIKPSLVGIELKGSDFVNLQGVSLKNVSLIAKNGDKVIFNDFGEMLFTHFGISGPIVLSCSSVINRKDLNNVSLYVDLKPALNHEILNNRLLREFKENNTKILSSVMRSLLPKALIDVVLLQAGISGNKNCSEITVNERERLIISLKQLKFLPKKLRPIEEAIVTAGGVSVKEINPKTMESKIIKGLFFAGEVIDVDAVTGGYNLQIAFSTGYTAGNNA